MVGGFYPDGWSAYSALFDLLCALMLIVAPIVLFVNVVLGFLGVSYSTLDWVTIGAVLSLPILDSLGNFASWRARKVQERTK